MPTNSTVDRKTHNAAALDDQGRIDIKSLSLPALQGWFEAELGESADRALRVYKQLWQQGARSFEQMPTIPKGLRQVLTETAVISFLEPALVLRSEDGTIKFLWTLHDGHTIESVLIPDGERMTLCMSSQVGCAMACTFCLTGDMGLKRHLTAGEIANQALQVGRQILNDGLRITNLVFMGMGEPLHNLPALLPALENCLHDNGLNFSHRRVTVSTVGLVPKMAELAAALPVNLAVSINATTEAQRLAIMPITQKYSLAELVQGCRDFPMPSNKRITFEYVMMDGFNDSLADAERLFGLLKGIPYKVNVIPYNENPDRDIKTPTPDRVKAFQHFFVSRGEHCSVRVTRGTDISAACGQLGGAKSQAKDQRGLPEAQKVAGLSETKRGLI
jgi:23S rRNA (adenine2503-C2)-methyltransferase